MRSIMDYVRAWRRRFGHPPRVPVEGATIATMSVGTGGYVAHVGVDSGGQAFVSDSEHVRWEPDYFSGVPAYFVERTGDASYALTIMRGRRFAASSKVPAARAVRFTALYEGPNPVHPHYQRVAVDRFQLWPESPSPS
jgi:hypothetical protein